MDTGIGFDKKKLRYFTNSVFTSCKNMKKSTKLLVLSWRNLEDKEILIAVLQNLQNLGFINYSAGFSSIKITLTAYGKLRVDRYKNWYD
jgi:hypothetical protein